MEGLRVVRFCRTTARRSPGTGPYDLEVDVPSKTRSARSSSSASRSSSAVLAPLADPQLAPPPSRLTGRPLRPEPFHPERGRPVEADGAPLTKFGGRFREVFAEAQGVDSQDVDLGLVRLVEALNADTTANLAALSAPSLHRTERGFLKQVRMIVNTPLLMPWLLNGRSLRRMPRELGNSNVRLVTTARDHDRFTLPAMSVGGPEDVLAIVSAQRRLLGFGSISSVDKKKLDRLNSIVQYGVLTPPDVVLTHLETEGGPTAWVPQVAEGAQRLLSSVLALDTLANRSTMNAATLHWFDPKVELRDYCPEDLRLLEERLRFPASNAADYFPGADPRTWLATFAVSTPGAVAFQLLRTVEVNLIVAVTPDPATERDEVNPVAAVLQEMIGSYHVPGKAKDAWESGEVQGVIAIGAIDDLRNRGRISDHERSVWLGEHELPWDGPAMHEDGIPGNRVTMVTKLLATLTAQGALAPGGAAGDREDSLEVVNSHLRRNSVWPGPDARARAGAAQAVVPLRQLDSGNENTIQAALIGTFNASWFWKTTEHPGGSWVSLITMPLHELAEKARAEQATADVDPGPAQRALAALGAVALISNPALVDQGKALTRTGRGGGGRTGKTVSASDPSALLLRMVDDPQGLDQLEDAVAALVATGRPTIPLDRVEHCPLEDLWLRETWFGVNRPSADDPETEFARRIRELIDAINESRSDAEVLREADREDMLNAPEDERGDDPSEPLYEALGINPRAADEALDLLRDLTEFFQVGKATARARARFSGGLD
jgi:hypothetical protein